ncbi:unnamed protein product [Linum trigynum]|uniref:Uncharacterized protein n=1 Tax=Linum trigynum TaxID=586398 RepID=A0AAV2CK14_9ROSI
MESETADCVTTRIGEKLRGSSPISSEFSIFRVPQQLRNVNERAYEPQVVAIGPYHHGKQHLQQMEVHKLHYLRQLLRRRIEDYSQVNRYVLAMRKLEESARRCYADSFAFTSDDFVEMMLLDGCFLVEVIRKYAMTALIDNHDPIFVLPMNLYSIMRDVLLLENQLPFFVLSELFQLTKTVHELGNFLAMVNHFLYGKSPGLGFVHADNNNNSVGCCSYAQDIKHLLGFAHDYWIPPYARTAVGKPIARYNLKFIRCATELREAGVKFRRAEEGEGQQHTLFDVGFKDGTFVIPMLTVEDETESFFRNLIAYEQLPLKNNPSYVTDYMVLMDCLINSRKDVELLRQYEIIDNRLGDDEVVANLFNRLGDYVGVSHSYFSYCDVFEEVNLHCAKKRYKWLAKLRHDYFNSPWALISFLAAVLLILLSFLQTLYSGLSYEK